MRPEVDPRANRSLRRALQALPRGSRVAVAGPWDSGAPAVAGRMTAPLSRQRDGSYLGVEPRCGRSAIVQLEAARARAFDYLLLPAAQSWWLDRFPELRSHLDRRYSRAHTDGAAGVIWSLWQPSPWRSVEDVLTLLTLGLGRDPVILDWNSESHIAAVLPDYSVFTPPGRARTLPYLESSVDVVVMGRDDRASVAEAHRIARHAVIQVRGRAESMLFSISSRNGESLKVADTLSIIVVSGPDQPADNWYVRWLADSMPESVKPELIVAGADASFAMTPDVAAHFGAAVIPTRAGDPWQQVVHAADAASSDWVALLSSDTWPLTGWVRAMLGGLAKGPGSGAATGLVLEPDGRILLAGGDVGPGNKVDRQGAGSYDVCAPRHAHARVVDFGSVDFTLARRDLLLAALRASDHAGRVEPDIRLGRQLRKAGASIRYEPEAMAVRSWAAS